jgi:hypothetical protein
MQSIEIANFGLGSATMQTGHLASGTYYYSLLVDGKLIDTKKLSVVLK